MKKLLFVIALTAVVAACEDRREKAISKIKEDEETIKRASAVVNEVIRNTSDCEAARALIPEAYKRIEEAKGQVQAPASGATLDALKSQVDRVAQVCP